MSWSEWARLDTVAMAELVRKGKVTPKELALQAVQAVELMNPRLNAVLELFDDAIAAPKTQGMGKDGPFYGVPLLVKDAGSKMKMRRQEYGCLFMEGVTAGYDDPLIRNFRAAGFNLIGRTAVPPQGMFAVTESLINGTTRNPWNLDYTSGGSSGGGSTVVASGMLPIATASDGGGSTRSPAGFTSLVGLKPTRGRLPMPYGVNEFSGHTLYEGVLTRSVRDTAAVLDIMWPKKPGETFMPIENPDRAYPEAIKRRPEQLRVALSVGKWGREPAVNREHIEHARAAAGALESLGHVVEEIEDSFCDWEAMWAGTMMNWVGSTRRWKVISAMTGIPLNKDTMEPVVYGVYQAAQRYDIWDVWRMQAANPIYTRQFGGLFQKFDLLLTPTDADLIPKCGPGSGYSPFEKVESPEDAVQVVVNMTDDARYLIPGNDAGFPAISLPSGLGHNGLPIGIQLHAPWNREDRLLQVSAQLEKARPEWFNQIAPLHVSHT